ncbi:MAG: S9 family peptidase [Bacteroidales bacterium]|nr:S9 family peptidase [Bacteroidales bacterium]
MKRLSLMFALILTAALSYAQKPALDHSVYDSWNTLRALSLPHNGDIMMYTINPGEGDLTLVIENIRTGSKFEIPRASRAQISDDCKTVIATIKPFYSQTREAKIKKVKKDDMPKDTLAIIDVQTGKIEKIANFKSYKSPDKFLNVFAFEMNPVKEKPAKEKSDKEKAAQEKPAKAAKPAKELYLKNIATGAVDTIKNVASYKFNKEGNLIAYTIEADKKDSTARQALMLYNVATKECKEVISGPKGSKIKLPEFSKVNTLAFFANTDTSKAAKNEISIWHYDLLSGELKNVADNKIAGLQEGWIVSENSSLSFSENGKRLFFGTAPKPREKDTTLVEFEQPQLDIWSWHDDYLQPVQLLKKSQDSKQTYTAYVNLENGKFVQLGDLEVPNVVVYNKQMADFVIVGNNKPYRIESQWSADRLTDIYVVNVNDGSRKLVMEKVCFGATATSPNGEWVIIYDKNSKNWFQYTIATGEFKNLTESLGVAFHDEDHDTPNIASPAGQAIWFEDNSAFVIGDRYDYWQFDPKGIETPKMFTDSYGRNNNTRLSMVSLIEDPERPKAVGRPTATIKNGETLFFTTFNFKTKETGLAVKDLSKKKAVTTKLVEGPYTFANFAYSKAGKGKKAAFIYARGNYEEGNNAFVTYDNFKTQKQLSDINTQQREYNWGTVELVNWQTADDIYCEGLLYKPENLDTTKKYPVMIYFYEKYSDKLFNPRFPAPSSSTINIPYFVSNGYVVFVPDIYYTEGHPGQSAMRSIMPGVEMLEKTYPWIDGENMAIQGQSWGGYQVAYMITQTDKFKAAGSGAPVANMTSAYGGIRWGSGITRQVQYEHGQSRIGKDLWSGYDLYIENSPIFFVPNVKTPVLIMHNDKDGAVPWYQGIEFFTALRRCGKIAWLLQYNDEEHNLEERRNAKDLSIRLSQFFDHYLKGAPMPKWMKHGRPATEKGFDLGYELTEE